MSLVSSLKVQIRVVGALAYRESLLRYGRNGFGYLSSLLVPLSQILFISALFTAIDRNNPLGGSVVLFIATAIIPYEAFSKLAIKMMSATKQASTSTMIHPVVTALDVLFAKLLVEVSLITVAAIVIFSGVGLFGYWDYSVDSLVQIILAFLTAIVLGFSVGLINTSITTKFAGYEKIWPLISKPLFFMSGIFYIASDRFPQEVLNILYYNPVLHITEWSRSAFYDRWESSLLDFKYLYGFVLTTLFFGLVSQRLVRSEAREV